MQVAAQLRRAIELLVQSAGLPDEKALSVAALYEPWTADKAYAAGHIVRHGEDDALYCVLQSHTSQTGWMPGDTPALYKRIGFTPGGCPLWVQPLGSADAYAKGDEVSHNGQLWESDVDNNVWEPGVYGWTEVT
jgi:hypothetical protein